MGTRLADVNGDGLIDIFRAEASDSPAYDKTYILINNGSGWDLSTDWSNSYPGCNGTSGYGCFVGVNDEDMGTRLADVNGDGLIDIFRAEASDSPAYDKTYILINNGSGWDLSTDWSNSYPGCNGTSGYGCFVGVNDEDMGTRLADVNGDGLIDIFRAEASDSPAYDKTGIFLNNGWASYLLNKVDISLGGGFSLSYQKSTYVNNTGNDSKSDLNFNIWLVFNITKNNNATGAHNTITTTLYNYTNGL